jgi:hypothetical protein
MKGKGKKVKDRLSKATKIVQQDYIDEEAQMKVEENKEGLKGFDTSNSKANKIGRECDGGIKVIP